MRPERQRSGQGDDGGLRPPLKVWEKQGTDGMAWSGQPCLGGHWTDRHIDLGYFGPATSGEPRIWYASAGF